MITNALKYAFPEGKGEIRVAAYYTGDDQIELIVQDNGIGLPEELDLTNLKSLGLGIVSLLMENQLEGSLDIRNEGGAHFLIRWPTRVGKERNKK